MDKRPVIIIGSGLAGYTLAREFRKLDTDTSLLILSKDHAGFYSKPMLSNALAQQRSPDSLLMKTAGQMATELNAEIRNHTEVSAIDPVRMVVTANGEEIAYRQLVLATGADPIRLPLQGNGAAEVLSVNDLDDYRAFRSRLEGKRKVLILGAGLIGCEFANDLSGTGYQVSVVDLAPQLLGRLLPVEVANHLQSQLEQSGIAFFLGTSISAIDKTGDGYQATLSTGQVIESDVVLSAIGLQPRTALARNSSIKVNRAVVVDQFMQTSASNIFALGDCAEAEGRLLPFVMPIMAASRALAQTLAGSMTAVQYPVMPITIKTPACPAVILAPVAGKAGSWEAEPQVDGHRAQFRTEAGQIAGFALVGSAVADKSAVIRLVAAS